MLIGFIATLFHGVDIDSVLTNFFNYSASETILSMFPLLLAYGLAGFRCNQISGGGISVRAGAQSFLFAASINNILPARIGDVMRLLYLKNNFNVPLRRSLPTIILERCFDMTALLIFVGFLAFQGIGVGTIWLPIVIFLILIMFLVFVLKNQRDKFKKRVLGIENKKLRVFLLFLFLVATCFITFSRGVKAGFTTLFIWFLYLISTGIFLIAAAKFNLDFNNLIIVFCLGVLGLLVPIAPGGAGTYHAGLVLGLTLTGIAKDQALSAAITLHLVKILPPLICFPVLFYKSDFILFSNFTCRMQK